jgi:integrase/recombinase XerD
MKDKFKALSKFIEDKNLTIAQKEVMEGFRDHLRDTKPHLTRYYLFALFRQALDFAIMIRKPFEEADQDDFEACYNTFIGNKDINEVTIEGYQNRLKSVYEYIYLKDKKYDEFSKIEKSIKHIFKKRLIEERRKLNEADVNNENLTATIKRYLGEGIKRQVFKDDKFVGYKHVQLSEKQRETLNRYYKRLRSGAYCKVGVHGLSATFRTLFQLGEFIKKPFEDVTEDDLVDYFFKLEEEKKSLATINSYKHIIKGFYIHFFKNEELVKDIKPIKKKIRKKEEEMLTPTEMRAMIEKCINPRDKCLIMVTYDGAMRQGEVLNIQLKDIESDDHGYKITISGKTGVRRVRLIDAVPYLKDWINYHPFKDDKNAYLFISLRAYGRKLKENGIAQVLKKAALVAGITKRVYPHLLRHSKLNQLAKEGFNERDLRIFAGWSSDSRMPDTYLHYDEKHVDRKILEKNGIFENEEMQKIEQEKQLLKPKSCPRCSKVQPADSLYCTCGMVLDQKEAVNLEVLREKANAFTSKLLSEPLDSNADLSKGIMEAMFQKVLKDPEKLAEIRNILE